LFPRFEHPSDVVEVAINESVTLEVGQIWANLRQRALDIAIAEITKKTDLNIGLDSLERAAHRRVRSLTFVIKEQAVPKGD
jgi:hypothetical protein